MRVIREQEVGLEPASHEDPANPGVLKRVLLRAGDLLKGRIQMLNSAVLRPGKSFCPHYHEDMQEVFCIYKGVVVMECAKEKVELHGGDIIVIDPKEVHTMKNIGETDAEYFVFGISTLQGGKTVVVGTPPDFQSKLP